MSRRPADIDLAGRQEDVDADVDQQAALDLAGDHAGNHVAFLVLLDDLFPFLLSFRLAVAQDDGAGLILDSVEQHLNLFTRLRRHDLVDALVIPFHKRDDPFALIADIHYHPVADDGDHPTIDNLVDFEFLLLVRQPSVISFGKEFL